MGPVNFSMALSMVSFNLIVALTQVSSQILSNTTKLNTEKGDIAHLVCAARDSSPLTISWKKAGKKLSDDSLGIATLVWTNKTITESHLFVAVSGEDKRGKYLCVVSNGNEERQQEFIIQAHSSSHGLRDVDYIAIGIGIGATLFLLMAVLVFVFRGSKRLKQRKGRTSRRADGRQENTRVEEECAAGAFRKPNGHHV